MKFSISFWSLILVTSCYNSKTYDYLVLQRITNNAPKGIIVSCLRCNCVMQAIDMNLSKITKPGIPLFGSKACISDSLNFRHIDQASVDSFYSKNYNLMLFKKKGARYKVKLLKTEEAASFSKILDDFFG